MEIQDTSPRHADIRREVYQNKHSQRQCSFDECSLLSIVSRKLLARRNEEMVVEIHSQQHSEGKRGRQIYQNANNPLQNLSISELPLSWLSLMRFWGVEMVRWLWKSVQNAHCRGTLGDKCATTRFSMAYIPLASQYPFELSFLNTRSVGMGLLSWKSKKSSNPQVRLRDRCTKTRIPMHDISLPS